MDDYYLYSGASFFVKKIIEGCSEYSNYIYATLVINYNFTAFPKQNYGQLTGTVTSISTDSTVQEDGNSYYLVEATLDQTAIEDREGNMKPIRSGMSAEASVVTETKKVIHFVLEKINLKD